jgi:hypothetical protein
MSDTYTTEYRDEIVRRLSAGVAPDTIAEKLSVPVSQVKSIARSLDKSASTAVVATARDVREVMRLPEQQQGDYFDMVMRTTALKVATLIETMPPTALMENAKSVIALSRWAQRVVGKHADLPTAEKAKSGAAGPALNLNLLLRRPPTIDAKVRETEPS